MGRWMMGEWMEGSKGGTEGRREEKRRLHLTLSSGIILNSRKILCVL